MQALSWMADEEARHGRWFSNLRERVAEREADPRLAKIGRQILKDYLGEQTFSLKDADLPGMRSLRDLLQLAEEFERDTVVFYELLGAAIEVPETLLQIEQIISEERRHAKVLAYCSNEETEEAALLALLSAKDSGI
jgi:rubrerythrin